MIIGKLLLWLCSVVLAFALGVEAADPSAPDDSELQSQIREHLDVIVDEAAGIADDIGEEIRNSDEARQASEFVDDVREILENTKDDIEAHFGSGSEKEVDAEDGIMEAPEDPVSIVEGTEPADAFAEPVSPENSDG